jgi:GT2 family glycosyltransferase
MVSVVVIGRNEGARLAACVESVRAVGGVYVDSGSADGSVDVARGAGLEVVELDGRAPFSAGRARNAGVERLRQIGPDVAYVQFVDGDCVLAAEWLEQAQAFLEAHGEYAVVGGRLRERHPEASVYNRLCQMEWDVPAGDAKACGGIAMMRVDAWAQVGGFNGEMIAGEEPELCVRLRQAGWKIRRLDCEMAWHDAAMLRFGQWWKRAVRAGHAYALGASMHGELPERHWVREVRSNWFWGLLWPLGVVLLAWPTRGWSLVGVGANGVLAARIWWAMRRRGFGVSDALLYAVFCVLAKYPNVQGQCRFWWGRMCRRPATIMEYKRVEAVVRL